TARPAATHRRRPAGGPLRLLPQDRRRRRGHGGADARALQPASAAAKTVRSSESRVRSSETTEPTGEFVNSELRTPNSPTLFRPARRRGPRRGRSLAAVPREPVLRLLS